MDLIPALGTHTVLSSGPPIDSMILKKIKDPRDGILKKQAFCLFHCEG
jgi:hypothetical protein